MKILKAVVDTKALKARDGKLCSFFKASCLSALIFAPTLLTGCGFHLRGLETPMSYVVSSTALHLPDDSSSFYLKQPLKQSLNAVGVNVVDDIGRQINDSNQQYTAAITVDNIRFKKYELVGVLTEVRLVLSADVTYQTLSNIEGKIGKPITVKNPIQVERSYQFNEATVSVEDQQGEQIRDWLYDSLAKRIADQYVALNLPRVAPRTISTAPTAESVKTTNSTPSSTQMN